MSCLNGCISCDHADAQRKKEIKSDAKDSADGSMLTVKLARNTQTDLFLLSIVCSALNRRQISRSARMSGAYGCPCQ